MLLSVGHVHLLGLNVKGDAPFFTIFWQLKQALPEMA
jgi:hypothetical protein